MGQVCFKQTDGIVDGGSFAGCNPWPSSCANDHSCSCLRAALGSACGDYTCGVNGGVYEYADYGC